MADRPIIFSGPMVRALLQGRKTQTRRVLKPQTPMARIPCEIGDRLWVRETWGQTYASGPSNPLQNVVYRADATDMRGDRWPSITPGDPHGEVKWRPSIHMPKWASRLTLHVKNLCIECLKDINEEDAVAEGCPGYRIEIQESGEVIEEPSPVSHFAALWKDIHGGGAWDANPWVCAITFEVEHANIGSARAVA